MGAIVSSKGNYKATVGSRPDSTYTVRTYLVGDREFGGMEIWLQDGFPTMAAAREWAMADLELSERQNAIQDGAAS
jgi:hypothetical protein